MKHAFAAALAALLLVLATLSPARAAPVDDARLLEKRAPAIPIDQIKILDVSYGGTGCPAGSAAWTISEDKTALTVIYDNFIASAGQNVSYTENRKFCQLSVKMKFPQGLTFSLHELIARGSVQLDDGTWGKHQSLWYFSGERRQAVPVLNQARRFVGLTEASHGPM
ncbi:hypothetical protein DFJ74DRAFT_703423 [Hyaloraphidium curvatum]|nr:hypothetical protein DFJ74DRAFT_703423 [Hyaloraphidium curvatum]